MIVRCNTCGRIAAADEYGNGGHVWSTYCRINRLFAATGIPEPCAGVMSQVDDPTGAIEAAWRLGWDGRSESPG